MKLFESFRRHQASANEKSERRLREAKIGLADAYAAKDTAQRKLDFSLWQLRNSKQYQELVRLRIKLEYLEEDSPNSRELAEAKAAFAALGKSIERQEHEKKQELGLA